MTAAAYLEEDERRPADALRDLRNDPRHLRALLDEARAELVAARAAQELLVELLHRAVRRHPTAIDGAGDARVLGALLLGHAQVGDLAGVDVHAFVPELRTSAAPILSLLELEASPRPPYAHLLARLPKAAGPRRRAALLAVIARAVPGAALSLAGMPLVERRPVVELLSLHARGARR